MEGTVQRRHEGDARAQSSLDALKRWAVVQWGSRSQLSQDREYFPVYSGQGGQPPTPMYHPMSDDVRPCRQAAHRLLHGNAMRPNHIRAVYRQDLQAATHGFEHLELEC